jgi:predicted ATPase/class 3 adenylate cyclase/tetratricopeptide (TPR) repeat protein
MNQSLPTGTVTFLFTDIEGSTQLWERFPQRMREALSRHDGLLRAAIEAHDGRVVKGLGDGVYAVFRRAGDAVEAAIAAQRALAEIRNYDLAIRNEQTTADSRRPTTDPLNTDLLNTDSLPTDHWPLIRVRMGIHTGEAELREGDYHGTALNRAERLMSAGHGGQILLSSTTASVCEGALPPGATLRDLGEHRLRGLTRPERVYQLLMPDLPANFPPLRALGEYVVSLPTPATGFVSRGAEVQQIVDLLNNPATRLLSLVGPGGAGKTRLAIQAAAEIGREGDGRFLDGVYFVPLAPLCTCDSMTTAVAQTFGFRFRQSEEPPRRQLLDFLRTKRVLLVMDNFEHLLADGAADLPAEILESAPDVGILATSRTRLNVQGEHLITIGGMRAPDAYTIRRWQAVAQTEEEAERAIARAATEYSAMRLFTQSAARVRPGFRLRPDNVADVARICRQVQGLPLGIELAAAWLEALTLPEIAEEIEHNLDILATEQRGVPDRQRSIRAVFDTSWALLTDRERAILPMLSVFRGGFAREAAEFVAAATLRDLLGLVNKSWLQPVELRVTERSSANADELRVKNVPSELVTRHSSLVTSSGRYMLHALLRQYAEEKLAELPELEARARDRQARYFARFLESHMRRMLGPEQARAFDAVAEEFDDIRQAWEFWAGRGEFGRLVDQMLLPLFIYASARFVGTDVAPLLDQAIELRIKNYELGMRNEADTAGIPSPNPSQGEGNLPLATRDLPLATRHLPPAAASDVALASLLIARTAIYANYFTQEFTPGDIRAAWAIAEALGDEAPRRLLYWYAVLNLIYGYRVEREPALANLRAFAAAPVAADEFEGEGVRAFARQSLARLLIREFAPQSDVLEARELMQAALAVFERMGNHDARASAYVTEADICTMLGQYDEALTFLDRAQPAAESVGNWGQLWSILLFRREIYLQRGRPERMFPVFDEMLAMSRRVGNFRLECWTLSWDSIYALRYHSTERALFKRQGAMVLAEEFGLDYDRAWSALEIGDVYRVMGDAAGARRWFDVALPLFQRLGDEQGVAFYRRGLGDLALARGEWAEAYEHHAAYLDWGENRDTWARIYALCGLSRAAVGLGRHDEALGRCLAALRLAVDSGRHDAEALPVACLAHLAAAGRPALAARLAAVVVASPLAWIETREWVRPVAQAVELAGEQEKEGAGEMEALVGRLLAVEGETVEEWLGALERILINLST